MPNQGPTGFRVQNAIPSHAARPEPQTEQVAIASPTIVALLTAHFCAAAGLGARSLQAVGCLCSCWRWVQKTDARDIQMTCGVIWCQCISACDTHEQARQYCQLGGCVGQVRELVQNSLGCCTGWQHRASCFAWLQYSRATKHTNIMTRWRNMLGYRSTAHALAAFI